MRGLLACCVAAAAAVACGSQDGDPVQPEGGWSTLTLEGTRDMQVRDVTYADGQVWATFVYVEEVPDEAESFEHRSALAHFDGDDWQVRDTGAMSTLGHVWASGPDDVWLEQAVIEGRIVVGKKMWRGDGQTWEETSLPAVDEDFDIMEIAGLPAGDPWLLEEGGIYRFEDGAFTLAADLAPMFGRPDFFAISFCATGASSLWIAAWIVPDSFVPEGVLLRGEDDATWTTSQRGDEPVRWTADLVCNADGLWAAADDSGATAIHHIEAGVWNIVDRPFEEHSDRAPPEVRDLLPLGPEDIWFILFRDIAFGESLVELWHYDGNRSQPIDLADLPAGFVPTELAPAPGGGVWVFGQAGIVARFTPAASS